MRSTMTTTGETCSNCSPAFIMAQIWSLICVCWIASLFVFLPDSIAQDAGSQVSVPKIILDCDPAGFILTGLDVDDDLTLLNIISLHRQGVIDLLGIMITGGNAPIDNTFPNALELIRRRAGVSGEEIGIYRGGKPLIATSFEYQDDLLNVDIATIPSSDATDFLITTILGAQEHTITILCIGPLTNLASAFLIEPQIASRLERVVTMGGTLTPGLPYDLNIRTDPVAAAIVWNHMDCPKIALPVETCIQAAFGPLHLRHVQEKCGDKLSTGTPIVCSLLTRLKVQRIIMPWLVNWRYRSAEHHLASKWIDEGFIVWDLVALWAAIRPELFQEWTYFNASISPGQPTGYFSSKSPKILLGHSFAVKTSSTHYNVPTTNISLKSQDNRGRICIPMRLANESMLMDLVLEHLYFPSHNVFEETQSSITLRRRLGSLPEILVAIGVALFGSFIVWKMTIFR